MELPAATYRVQLNKSFTFRHLEEIVDYLHDLGISTVYASPVCKANEGSLHGYDVTDPDMINPETGTREEMRNVLQRLRQKNMGWLQDMVPNHMAFSTEDTRLMDVMERGPFSPFYRYFDIDWNHPDPELKGRLMVPVLGKDPKDCIGEREIRLSFTAQGFALHYFDHSYPLSLPAWQILLGATEREEGIENLAWTGNEGWTPDRVLAGIGEEATVSVSLKEWLKYKAEWTAVLREDAVKVHQLEAFIDRVNRSPELLEALLRQQYYVLTYWKAAEKKIDYRRFFTVNELISLRMEDPDVFEDYHAGIYDLYKEGLIDGLRLDHIDGLNDPGGYFKALRRLFGNELYTVVEKILEEGETMPEQWPLQGTTGYEFLAFVSRLLTESEGAEQLLRFYRETVPGMPPYEELVFEKKKLILEGYMQGEWENLLRYLYELQLGAGELNREGLKQALALVMLCLPVYRIYPEQFPLTEEAMQIIAATFARARRKSPHLEDELDFLQSLFAAEEPASHEAKQKLRFLKRLMQFTGPLMAKGVEDTTFYVYNALLSHNEVGDTPAILSMTAGDFHERMIARQKHSPLSLNTTSTHDTKRGEDARVRLNVLSAMPGEWREKVTVWRSMNSELVSWFGDLPAPTANDEYFIYQSLLAGFPADYALSDDYLDRFGQYMIKALREAKENTNWSEPDERYEKACISFIQAILSEGHGFLPDFLSFLEKVCRQAVPLSTAQALIKITAPGIPDIYQGCELWDLSYVDPDNRREVDYALRREYLDRLVQKEKEGPEALLAFVGDHRAEGLEKMFVTRKALHCRRVHKELFLRGSYRPLYEANDEKPVLAFARVHGKKWITVVAPLKWTGENVAAWEDVVIHLPGDAPREWVNEFTGETVQAEGSLPLKDLLKDFPFALLRSV